MPIGPQMGSGPKSATIHLLLGHCPGPDEGGGMPSGVSKGPFRWGLALQLLLHKVSWDFQNGASHFCNIKIVDLATCFTKNLQFCMKCVPTFAFFVNKIWIYKAYVSVFVHIKEKIKDILLKLYNFLACAAEIFGKGLPNLQFRCYKNGMHQKINPS